MNAVTAHYAIPLLHARVEDKISVLAAMPKAKVANTMSWECIDHDPENPVAALRADLKTIMTSYEDNYSLVKTTFDTEDNLKALQHLVDHLIALVEN